MGLLIAYCLGAACIVFPKQAAGVIQGIIDHLVDIQSKRMNTEVADEDKTIGSGTSILIGIVIVLLTAFAHSQAG